MIILESQVFKTIPKSPEQSCIFLNNTQTDKVVDGTYLELCIKAGCKYLVFITDDTPYEDMLHIHLLNKHLDIVDSATIGSMYSTGFFRNYNIQNSNTLTFNFIGDTKWKIEILGSKEFLFPLISSLKGASRKSVFYQYFKVYSTPSL